MTDQELIDLPLSHKDRFFLYLRKISPSWVNIDFLRFGSPALRARAAALRRIITPETLDVLSRNSQIPGQIGREYAKYFQAEAPKIGGSITVQRP